MKEKKKKLDFEELEKVVGGIEPQGDGCESFMNAFNKPNINICDNCFFYHKDEKGARCDSPLKDHS